MTIYSFSREAVRAKSLFSAAASRTKSRYKTAELVGGPNCGVEGMYLPSMMTYGLEVFNLLSLPCCIASMRRVG